MPPTLPRRTAIRIRTASPGTRQGQSWTNSIDATHPHREAGQATPVLILTREGVRPHLRRESPSRRSLRPSGAVDRGARWARQWTRAGQRGELRQHRDRAGRGARPPGRVSSSRSRTGARRGSQKRIRPLVVRTKTLLLARDPCVPTLTRADARTRTGNHLFTGSDKLVTSGWPDCRSKRTGLSAT